MKDNIKYGDKLETTVGVCLGEYEWSDEGTAVYRVALIQTRGSYLVVTYCTEDVQVTLDRPVTLGLIPVELSTSISVSHAATYVVNSCVS